VEAGVADAGGGIRFAVVELSQHAGESLDDAIALVRSFVREGDAVFGWHGRVLTAVAGDRATGLAVARRLSSEPRLLAAGLDARLVEDVADALARADLEPSSLIVEVTESILASESGHVIATLDELRRTGIRVAIDDFGTGYSSFAALAELPIDILKIDKRFVDNLVFDDQGRGFVNAIMQLAHTLHLETTAEGVEKIEQRDALALLGCTHIQGYFFSPPMPGDQTHDYLARGGERHRPALI